MIRKWDIAGEQAQKRCVEEVLARIDEQQDAEFGIIAAQEIIDIVADHIGPSAYNTGIEDAKKAIVQKSADLEIELDMLKTSS